MKRIFVFALTAFFALSMSAQDRLPSSSMWLKAYPLSGAKVPYAYDATGTEYHVNWGMDVAWNDAGNVQRGVNYIGTDILNTGRVSFQPTDPVGEDLVLSSMQISHLSSRARNIMLSEPEGVMMNLDHPGEQYLQSYRDYYKGNAYHYYLVIKASVLKYKELGVNVISIAPLNEPDYTYNEAGSKRDFKNICQYLANDPDLAGIRICGGNTLNDDQASSWYNYMKPYINEGNTHQLAGNFNNYANFFQEVRRDGNHATADELHNTMEAFVAVHYGLQTGIWWGYDGLARGDFCKATHGGHELGYGENRSAWAAGCVYRLPSGAVEAFVGVSERQANKNWMDIVATDHDVFYDGYGPVRLYQQFLPGDGVYGSDNQKNADKVIHIHSGEDVPLDTIGGVYEIMNKKTSKLLAPANTNTNAAIQQMARKNRDIERWDIQPTNHLSGGDFSYYRLVNVDQNKYCNLLNNSVNAGATFILYNAGGYANEQYAFEYAGDGWYYIRNHLSGLYLEGSGTTLIKQGVFTGKDQQKWRLMPADAKCEQVAPAAPTNVRTLAHPASVVVSWDAPEDKDLNCYIVIRGYEKDGETVWETIGRKITTTAFIDNSCEQGKEYVYKVKAVDLSGNRSEDSETATGATDGEKTLVAYYEFDNDLNDLTVNQFDAVSYKDMTFSDIALLVKSGTHIMTFDGTNNYLMLPPKVADMKEMTISFWMNNSDVSRQWARLFDFGSDQDHYMFFTPNSGDDSRFVMKNGGNEQILSINSLGTGWKFVAITIGEDAVKIYVNGEEMASSSDITIRPSDIKPAMCFVGRSQFVSDPLYKGRLDAMRIYNYAQSIDEIKADMMGIANAVETIDAGNSAVVSTEYYTLSGERTLTPANGIFIMKQRCQDGTVRVKKIFRN